VPKHVAIWSLDFLNDRKQLVKTVESVSSTTVIRAGTPQGTVSCPNDFKLVINDLSFNITYAEYVDDTTVLLVSKNVNDHTRQAYADNLVHWTPSNRMIIHNHKTKKLIVLTRKLILLTSLSCA